MTEKKKDQDWDAFYQACDKDYPVYATINTLRKLEAAGAEIWIFSGRSDVVRSKTEMWLAKAGIIYSWLQMRSAGDYTKDDELKLEWYNNMLQEDVDRLVAVFEDRDRMVRMWRSINVPCFQVAPGDF